MWKGCHLEKQMLLGVYKINISFFIIIKTMYLRNFYSHLGSTVL